MVTTKAKRSVHPSKAARQGRQSTKTITKLLTHQLTKSAWLRKILRFPQTKGKIVESVEFSTELGYHCISVNFDDKTSLNFALDSSFTVETDYSNWKTGNQRVLHRWRPVQNLDLRATMRKRKK